MLDAKNYKVTIVGSFTGESAEKKTPYYGLELETACGEFIEYVAYLTDKTAKRQLETLKKAGFVGNKLSDLSNDKLDMEELFNIIPTLSATIEHEEYTNKDGEIKVKAVVKWLNDGSFGAEKADHAKSVQIFANSKYDGMMKQMKNTVKTKKEEAKPEGSEIADEDLPF